jgi:transposase
MKTLETAKLNGLNPEAYLANAIDRMAKGHPVNRLADLLPLELDARGCQTGP